MTTLYLASGSPRRQELLTQLGLSFERLVPGIEERRGPQESAQHYVARLAREKRWLAWRWRRAICRCWARIRLSFLMAKCWKSRATPGTPQKCFACFPENPPGDDRGGVGG